MIRVRLVRGKNIAATFRGIALLGALLLALFPVYWMLTLATETQGEVVAAHVRLLPTFHSFGGISHSSRGRLLPYGLQTVRLSHLVLQV